MIVHDPLRALSAFFPFGMMLLGTVMTASQSFAGGSISGGDMHEKHAGLASVQILKQSEIDVPDTSASTLTTIQNVASALNELQASALTGPMLEKAIVKSRETEIAGALPIPQDIRQQLTGYASDDSMNRVRYKIGNDGSLNLAHLIELGGFADAVTLIDVVVFREASGAANVSAWAHELTHVDQFRDWGVHDFAVRYARNWRDVEGPAYAKGDGFDDWRSQQARASQERAARSIECSSGLICNDR